MSDLFTRIESFGASGQLGVFSGWCSLKSWVESQDWFIELLQFAENHPDQVKERLIVLFESPYDPHYAHPHDNQIVVYLMALRSHHAIMRSLYMRLLNKRQLFWTRYVLEEFIQE